MWRGNTGARTARRAAALCACALSQLGEAHAGTLRILPVRIEVAADKRFCSLSISNDDPKPVAIQIRGFGWRKEADGTDILEPANGPIINPSIVAIPTGETRLIRCSLPDQPGAIEQSYRLIIDELPEANPIPGTIQARLRISIPVFRAPARAAPALDWKMRATQAGGTPDLVLSNRGNRHAQVSAIILHSRTPSSAPRRIARGFYLLAKGCITFPLSDPPPDGIVRVEVETTDGRLSASPIDPGDGGD